MLLHILLTCDFKPNDDKIHITSFESQACGQASENIDLDILFSKGLLANIKDDLLG